MILPYLCTVNTCMTPLLTVQAMNNKLLIASLALPALLFPAPAAAQKYQLSGVERTRVLIDKRYDANPDKDAAKFIAPYKAKVDSIMGPVVGVSAQYMSRYKPESELGNLLADILVWGGRDFGETPDFAVYNVGGIRANLPKGNVTVGDIIEIAPFENKICFMTLTGEQVLELFGQIAHRGGEALSHSVRMTIHRSDNTLASLTIGGREVNPKATYRVATLDYLAEGNDQLTVFKKGTDRVMPGKEENNTRYIIMDYFRDCQKQGKNVESGLEGRAKFVE